LDNTFIWSTLSTDEKIQKLKTYKFSSQELIDIASGVEECYPHPVADALIEIEDLPEDAIYKMCRGGKNVSYFSEELLEKIVEHPNTCEDVLTAITEIETDDPDGVHYNDDDYIQVIKKAYEVINDKF
tara:strand:+ start:93 stop:476 length:384 start_codon:yes stop_codon:yes gene_type:complete